ncbi:MAG: FAD-dependent oxidoreductase [Pyrinomonadaceae bacterium]
MTRLTSEVLVVGGGAAGLSAALAASAGAKTTLVDDNPHLGGQIWRSEMGKIKSPDAKRLVDAVKAGIIEILNDAAVFAAAGPNVLLAETPKGSIELEFRKLIIASGARERFLPFPGWTLPNVFGAGGLQALVKGGLPVADKRIVVAGTGPLLLAVADYLKAKGAKIVAIAEQAPASKISKFALSLWRSPSKIAQGVALRYRLLGVPYLTDCWVTSAESGNDLIADAPSQNPPLQKPARSKGVTPSLKAITLTRHGEEWVIECDMLACGFHLVPNLELPSILGCKIDNDAVSVDEFQQTSVENIYCAGEPTGIGGLESSLIEGKVAGLASIGEKEAARSFFRQRDKARRFGNALNTAFALRDELKTLAEPETIVCRCEDVPYKALAKFANFRDAKLQTRCGMGPCQGRVCGAATEFLFGWGHPNVRPPIFPVKMEDL